MSSICSRMRCRRCFASGSPDRKVHGHRRHPVVQDPPLGLGPDRHRHQGPDHLALDQFVPAREQVAEATRDRRQYDIVDGPAERGPDRLHLGQAGLGPLPTPVRATRTVEGTVADTLPSRRAVPGSPGQYAISSVPLRRLPASEGTRANCCRGARTTSRTPSTRRSAVDGSAAGVHGTGAGIPSSGLACSSVAVDRHGHPVDHAVVHLGNQRPLPVPEALDQVHLHNGLVMSSRCATPGRPGSAAVPGRPAPEPRCCRTWYRISKCGSSVHTGRPRCSGTVRTRCRYRGTSLSLATSSRTTSPYNGDGVNTATDPTCIGVFSSSTKKNPASSVLIRSIAHPPFGNRRPCAQPTANPGPVAAAGHLPAYGGPSAFR